VQRFPLARRARTLPSVDVLVVDDHDALLDLVARALERDGHRVHVARSAREATLAMAERRFDVVVLDVALPDGSGLELCRRARAEALATPILLLTAHAAVRHRVDGLDAGADDFLGKPFAPAELRARVRALGRRRGLPAALAWQGGHVGLDFSRRRAAAAGREVPLTAREWAILELLAAARGHVVPRARILEEVWGDEGPSTAASLDVLVARVRKKLGDNVIRTARGEGYALGE
jgi:two-component system, OmpR family, response regulator